MLPELVDEIIDSDIITTIGKLLVLMALMMVMRFLDICGRQWNFALYQSKKEC
jgi:hypothetical protein